MIDVATRTKIEAALAALQEDVLYDCCGTRLQGGGQGKHLLVAVLQAAGQGPVRTWLAYKLEAKVEEGGLQTTLKNLAIELGGTDPARATEHFMSMWKAVEAVST